MCTCNAFFKLTRAHNCFSALLCSAPHALDTNNTCLDTSYWAERTAHSLAVQLRHLRSVTETAGSAARFRLPTSTHSLASMATTAFQKYAWARFTDCRWLPHALSLRRLLLSIGLPSVSSRSTGHWKGPYKPMQLHVRRLNAQCFSQDARTHLPLLGLQ